MARQAWLRSTTLDVAHRRATQRNGKPSANPGGFCVAGLGNNGHRRDDRRDRRDRHGDGHRYRHGGRPTERWSPPIEVGLTSGIGGKTDMAHWGRHVSV